MIFGKFRLPFTDIIFLLTFSLFLISIFLKKIVFRRHPFYIFLIAYFGSLLISAIFSINPRAGFIKLAGETYLIFLAVLTFNLVTSFENLKSLIFAWLAGTSVALLFGFLALFLFYFSPETDFLKHLLFYYGSLPPGFYPRIKSTFQDGNLFCNYLTASLMLTLIAGKLRWIGISFFYILTAGILLISLFTFSPGLGGIGLCFGVWFWLVLKERGKNICANLSLCAGIFTAIIFLLFTMIAFENHQSSNFVFNIPFFDFVLYPSVRILIWIDSFKTFLENPFVGIGLGENVCAVIFFDPSGNSQLLTEAHNTFLNVAGQSGLLGFSAVLAITLYFLRKFFNFSGDEKQRILKFGFGLIFLSCFFYQGLAGSFENARHIWVVIGIIMSLESANLTDRA